MQYPGKLISIEGIDGCGKSTFADSLKTALEQRVVNVLFTKQPGGSPLGKNIRSILQNTPVCAKAEYLLYAADRAQHTQEIIIPALQKGMVVISDRMNDSSVAYQGYGRELDIDMIKTINSWAMNDIKQDLIFHLVIDIQTALGRLKERQATLPADAIWRCIEQEKTAFWQRVSDGYEKIFANRAEVVRLDAQQNPTVMVTQALTILQKQGIIS